MIQDYLYGLDERLAAQIITIVSCPFALIQYFKPKYSARKMGMDASNPLVLWFVERIGIIHCQMGLSMTCIFFFNMTGSDAIGAAFTLWGLDSMRTALTREVLHIRMIRDSVPGVDEVLQIRGYRIDFLLFALTLLGWYQNKAWFESAMTVAFCWVMYSGLKFSTIPNQAWTEWGVSRGKRHILDSLGRIHAGSCIELVSFGLFLFVGMEPHRALGVALSLKLCQLFISRFVFCDEKVLHIHSKYWSFWIVTYIPIIFSLLSSEN